MAGRRELVGFFLLAFGFSWSCWLGSAALGGRAAWLASIAGQFGPFVAAVTMTAWGRGRPGLRGFFARLVRWRFHPIWLAVALLLPPAMYYASIFAHAAIVGEPAPLRPYRILYDVVVNFAIIVLIGGPLGEEPGWRGYAMPRLLQRWNRNVAITLLGVIWTVWHLPIWWVGGEFPVWVIVQCFVAMTAMSFLFEFLRERTDGSTLICVLFHGSFNTFFILLPMNWAHLSYVAVVSLAAVAAQRLRRRWEPARSTNDRLTKAQSGGAAGMHLARALGVADA